MPSLVFPLIRSLSACLNLKLLSSTFIRWQRLKKGTTYFRVKQMHHIQFPNFATIFFKTKTTLWNNTKLTLYELKNMKIHKYWQDFNCSNASWKCNGSLLYVYGVFTILVMYAFCFGYWYNVVMFLITATFRGAAVIRGKVHIARRHLF